MASGRADAQATDDQAGRAVMERFWAAAEAGDLDGMAALVADDIEMTWPQSGEHFKGRDNAEAAFRATPEKPEPAGEPRLLGCGDLWTVSVPLRYGEEVYHYVGIFELADGRIKRSTEYFGAPFPPNEARAPYAEPA